MTTDLDCMGRAELVEKIRALRTVVEEMRVAGGGVNDHDTPMRCALRAWVALFDAAIAPAPAFLPAPPNSPESRLRSLQGAAEWVVAARFAERPDLERAIENLDNVLAGTKKKLPNE